MGWPDGVVCASFVDHCWAHSCVRGELASCLIDGRCRLASNYMSGGCQAVASGSRRDSAVYVSSPRGSAWVSPLGSFRVPKEDKLHRARRLLKSLLASLS